MSKEKTILIFQDEHEKKIFNKEIVIKDCPITIPVVGDEFLYDHNRYEILKRTYSLGTDLNFLSSS
ncbi:MAG: hypothetical protein D3909_14865 [Candidatus Electrothrix sp. ATG1]|nr:hypothetical protein [Candidatus Electrothrix sp. ATG1]